MDAGAAGGAGGRVSGHCHVPPAPAHTAHCHTGDHDGDDDVIMIMMMMIQDHLTTKLKTSFGVEEDFSSAVSYVQNKVRRQEGKIKIKKWIEMVQIGKIATGHKMNH